MARFLNLFRLRRQRLERELERELSFHLESRVRDLTRDGVTEREARRRARLELGGVAQVQDEVRDTWIWQPLDVLTGDVRYALRSLAGSWSFTLGAGGVLALAIAANTAVFSIINTVLLEPLPYPDGGQIVTAETVWTNSGRTSPGVSGPDFLDWQAQNSVFAVLAHSFGEDDMATTVDGRAEFANVQYVSAGFFGVFGQPPSAGRFLTRDDAVGADEPALVAVVGHRWAESHFGSPEAAVGRSVEVYGVSRQIVGVAPRGFYYPGMTNIWTPDGRTNGDDRGVQSYAVVGRLKTGVDLASASVQMRTIAARLAGEHEVNQFKSVSLTPLQERLTGGVRATLWILMAAVSMVMLIACANVANLLVARAASRTREIALRAALGAGRGRVVRQLLTESVVLAAFAVVAGVLLASLLVQAVVAISPANLPRVDEIRIDGRVVVFALGLAAVSTLAFGLLPALGASRLDLSDALKQGGAKGAVSAGSGRVRSALVVVEVALSVVLLAASALLLRSFLVLNQVDLGFTTDRVLVAYTQYVVNSAEEARTRIAFYRDFLDRIRAVPGVSAAAGMAFLPLGKEPRPPLEYVVEGRAERRPGEQLIAEIQAITPGYFATLEIPLRGGRDFTHADAIERPPVAIVNETLARAAFGEESALGRRIKFARSQRWMEIVGVAADTRWRDPSQSPPAEVFLASSQGAGGSLSLVARTTIDEQELAGTLRSLLHEANPSVPVRFETMEELFAGALAYPRFRTQLIGAFGGVAALLAAVGIFSVLAYLVGQRTREIAVRRAVGAGAADVVRLIVGQGLRLVAAGLAIGVIGALVVSRLLEGLLFAITPWDVGSYAAAIGALGAAAFVAMLVPALRAATIDPLMALRQE